MKQIKILGITLLVSLTVRRIKDDKLFMPIIPNPDLGYYKSLLALGDADRAFIDWMTVKNNPSRFEIIHSFRTDEIEDFLDDSVVNDGNPMLIKSKLQQWAKING